MVWTTCNFLVYFLPYLAYKYILYQLPSRQYHNQSDIRRAMAIRRLGSTLLLLLAIVVCCSITVMADLQAESLVTERSMEDKHSHSVSYQSVQASKSPVILSVQPPRAMSNQPPKTP
ncbi:hypothetical protein SUGI_0625220 [Cryptomeria japonica]|nr:hypothetical protein SUGI_0625220 [Cryptomeria japonica]